MEGGLKKIAPIFDKKGAIKVVRQGGDVRMATKQEAKAVARGASDGKKVEVDAGHKLKDGSGETGAPHAHPNPRNGSHVFWSGAAAVGLSAADALNKAGDSLTWSGNLPDGATDQMKTTATGADFLDPFSDAGTLVSLGGDALRAGIQALQPDDK